MSVVGRVGGQDSRCVPPDKATQTLAFPVENGQRGRVISYFCDFGRGKKKKAIAIDDGGVAKLRFRFQGTVGQLGEVDN